MLNQSINRPQPTIDDWVFAEESGAVFDAKTMRHHFDFLKGKSQRYIQAFLGEIERQAMEAQPVEWTEF